MNRSTKGLGRTQPAEWQDCGDALDHPELRGCHMPKGPGKDVTDPQVYLQYNEVRIIRRTLFLPGFCPIVPNVC